MNNNEIYQSGSCNIGEVEIQQRKRIGMIGLIISSVFYFFHIIFSFFSGYSPLWGILIFPPSLIMTIGFVQARERFCAAFGLTNRYNLTDKLHLTLEVTDEDSKKRDRIKSYWIILKSTLYALAISTSAIIISFILVNYV
ncbi:hypothetical protein [Candidatus Hodarchaeum mangrovi]